MNRIYWDTEIAANAAAWVSSCDPNWPHSPEDERSNLGGYEILGENLLRTWQTVEDYAATTSTST